MEFGLYATFWVTVYTEVAVGDYVVRRVGNSERASTAGVDSAGAAFLLPDIFQADGVVYAFAAYYRNANPVRFQLWRPVDATESGTVRASETTVQLISQLSVTPSVENSRETVRIYVESMLLLISRGIR